MSTDHKTDLDDTPSADDLRVIAMTRAWLEHAVIGLNLCPFARAPLLLGRVRFRVSHAEDTDALLDDLCGELQSLHAADPVDCETTLLIHPRVLGDFLDYNDFLDSADAALDVLGLEGEVQVASFHPHYCFADAGPDDVDNATNRSPYPILHLLREASIERAIESIDDPEAIPRRNIETMQRLGREGWQSLLCTIANAGGADSGQSQDGSARVP